MCFIEIGYILGQLHSYDESYLNVCDAILPSYDIVLIKIRHVCFQQECTL